MADNHSAGTGIGFVAGTVAGAVMGSALGPLGAVTGAILGSGVGAVAGKGIAETLSPETEQGYWQSRYRDEPYFENEHAFEDYAPAYTLGRERFAPDMSFEAAEKSMSEDWEHHKGASRLQWSHARLAAQAAWARAAELPLNR